MQPVGPVNIPRREVQITNQKIIDASVGGYVIATIPLSLVPILRHVTHAIGGPWRQQAPLMRSNLFIFASDRIKQRLVLRCVEYLRFQTFSSNIVSVLVVFFSHRCVIILVT